MTDVDPFDEGVPRNGRGAPLIIPVNSAGKPNPRGKLKPYLRASTFARALSDGSGLTTWKVRHAAVALACHPDLAAMVAALGPNPDDYTREQKAELDSILDTAHDRSGGNAKANYGTAVHSLTEPDSAGVAIDPAMQRDIAAYEFVIDEACLDVVDSEQFVVCDELEVAGTFDHRYQVSRSSDLIVERDGKVWAAIPNGTVLIGDKKTGSLHFDEHAIQLALYARSAAYDHTTGKRTGLDVSLEWGVLAHIPKGAGKATLYLVDIAAGWQAAVEHAVPVRHWRSAASTKQLGTAFAEATAPVGALTGVVISEPVERSGPVPIEARRYSDEWPKVTADEATRPDLPAAPVAGLVDDMTAAAELVTREFAATDAILAAIATANDRDECAALWRRYTAEHAWTETHTEAVTARLAQLAA